MKTSSLSNRIFELIQLVQCSFPLVALYAIWSWAGCFWAILAIPSVLLALRTLGEEIERGRDCLENEIDRLKRELRKLHEDHLAQLSSARNDLSKESTLRQELEQRLLASERGRNSLEKECDMLRWVLGKEIMRKQLLLTLQREVIKRHEK